MFDVSTKVDYAMLIIVELAKSDNQEYLSLQDIADSHDISSNYLSQLAIPLKKANLIISKEGKSGGYKLASSPAEITIRDVVEAIEGPLTIVRCMHEDAKCPAQETCATRPVWHRLKKDIYKLLDEKSIQDIL
ncbi:MAG: Rrf2 family transcriptional regulator [bacterium]|nr:Rrf2 family transcriptional regulator [bacterium]